MSKQVPTRAQAPSDFIPLDAPPQPARRRLLRGGLVGVPTVLALKSSPVLAANCRLPSGFSVSGNLSRSGQASCSTSAHRPSHQAAQVSGLPLVFDGTQLQPTHLFSSLGLACTTSFPDAALASVLLRGDLDPQALVASCFLFSVAKGSADGVTGFPGTSTITQLWAGYLDGSYVVGSVHWGQAQVVAYLRYLTGQA